MPNENAYRENRSNRTGIVDYSTIEEMINVTSGTPKLVDGTASFNVTGTVRTEGYKEYIPHSAFEFDGGKAGMWVGKYEPSGSASLVTIKPNATMIRNTEWGPVSYLAESKYGINST